MTLEREDMGNGNSLFPERNSLLSDLKTSSIAPEIEMSDINLTQKWITQMQKMYASNERFFSITNLYLENAIEK
jgi:hypothetical protein